MSYVQLYKLETKANAEFPQEWKYPSNTVIAEGFMYDHTIPVEGKQFYLYKNKLSPFFQTSIVEKVIKNEKGYYIETINSKYQILVV